MKKSISFLLFIFLQTSLLFGNISISKGSISGYIFDNNTKQALEYATISLYIEDTILVTGSITDTQGYFILENIKYGTYSIKISFLGYSDYFLKNIIIDDNHKEVIIPNTFLSPDTKLIDEIEIVGKENQIDYKIDKKVITVGENLASSSLSAVEVLKNLPSIRVDIDGNVSLRGNSGFTVLIDGKPTVLEASDVLNQIPAAMIKNIEIITNPSAKYQPDGVGGIINIITKKNNTRGWQGLINGKIGSFNSYGADMLVSYKNEHITIFCSADFSDNPSPAQTITDRHTTIQDSTTYIKEEGTSLRNRQRKSIKVGFDWHLDTNNTITFESQIGTFSMNSTEDATFNTYYNYKTDSIFELSNNISKRGGNYWKTSLGYVHSFKQKDHSLALEASYRYRKWTESSESFIYSDPNIILEGGKTTEDGPSNLLDAKLDYILPLRKKQKLESGINIRIGLNEDNTGIYTYDTTQNIFIEYEALRNSFEYHRNIYAAYFIYSGMFESLGYQVGIRPELTDRTITSDATDTSIRKTLWDIFPTLHISYKLSESNQLMTSYSRRIDRPRSYYLKPFLTWTDLYNARKGNPDLQPEYIDAIELAYINKHKKSTISFEAYYHIKKNKIERIKSAYTQEVLLTEFANVGTDYSLGLESMFNTTKFKWWELSILGNVYYYRLKGNVENTSLNWSLRMNNTFPIVKTLKLQIDGEYNSPSATSQGLDYETYSINAALRADFFKRSLSAVFQVRDIFGTDNHKSLVDEADFYVYREHTHNAPVFMFSLSYKINNYKTKRGKGSNQNDDDF